MAALIPGGNTKLVVAGPLYAQADTAKVKPGPFMRKKTPIKFKPLCIQS